MFCYIILLLPTICYCNQMLDLDTLNLARRYTFYEIPKPTVPAPHHDENSQNQPLNPLSMEEQKLQTLKMIAHDYLKDVANITGTKFANEKVRLGRNQGSFKFDVNEDPFYVNILISWTPGANATPTATTTTSRPV